MIVNDIEKESFSKEASLDGVSDGGWSEQLF